MPSSPPLAEVRLEPVQLRFPVHGVDQQLIDAGGAGEPLHGLAVQVQGAADRGQRLPGAGPLADLAVAFPGARDQPPFPAARVQGPVRRDLRGLRLPRRLRLRQARGVRGVRTGSIVPGGLILQAATMPGHRLLGGFCQVVPQMPAICDLEGVRRAVAGALRVGAGPVPADDLRTWMRLQPRLHGRGLTVRQQVHCVPGADVHQHRPVHVPLAQREIITPRISDAAVTCGSGSAMTRRSTVEGCTAMPSVPASRAAALPARCGNNTGSSRTSPSSETSQTRRGTLAAPTAAWQTEAATRLPGNSDLRTTTASYRSLVARSRRHAA